MNILAPKIGALQIGDFPDNSPNVFYYISVINGDHLPKFHGWYEMSIFFKMP
jgi:hypothetical protein